MFFSLIIPAVLCFFDVRLRNVSVNPSVGHVHLVFSIFNLRLVAEHVIRGLYPYLPMFVAVMPCFFCDNPLLAVVLLDHHAQGFSRYVARDCHHVCLGHLYTLLTPLKGSNFASITIRSYSGSVILVLGGGVLGGRF